MMALLATLLTFWPPGPPDRAKVNISSPSGTWTASVISTAFTGDAGQTAVPALNVHYVAGTITVSGVVATTPVTTDLTGVSPVVNGTSTGLASASWNPTVSVVVPAGAAAGTYTATITHSVA